MSIGDSGQRTVNILVIEDEFMVQETLSDMLDLGGYQVTLADTGEDGVLLFEKHDFDLVLTDLTLPGISGWEVVEAIKRLDASVPVVVVTGWGAGTRPSDVEQNRADEILPKPFEIDHVLELAERLTDERKRKLGSKA